MLKDITLGQYFPGDTVVHRLDPRTKIILVLVYIISLFQATGWAGYAFITLLTALCLKLSHIRAKNIFKGLYSSRPMPRQWSYPRSRRPDGAIRRWRWSRCTYRDASEQLPDLPKP
ncbi:MAG: energy-coupling factor transporter transmembrane protein EcfT, partial [Oscillospiraceae bacterium]|nr:energy-coupling factor transporter transmembrane protein EcfT [Oscillospiraceae bacterium]